MHVNTRYINSSRGHMPGESIRRWLRSLLLYLCYIFLALINSLVCWFCMSTLGFILFHFCNKLCLMVQHHTPCSRYGSRLRFKISVTLYLDSIFWAAELFVTKLGMMLYHLKLELERHAKILVCYLQVQGHSELNYNVTVSFVSSELLILFQADLVGWYIIIAEMSFKIFR